MRSRLLAIAASTVLLSFLAACGSSDEEPSAEPSATATASASASATAGAASGECVYTEASEAGKKAELPPTEPKSADSLTIKTNRGDIKTTLTPDAAPCTVNSFVSLAEQGFYDGVNCHRLVVDFVLQCGDPTGTGSGGPGYSFADELSGSETYPAGTLAMANAGPDTNGSQFFIVLEDAQLPPSYTVFGSVDAAGLKVAQDIAAKGNGPDGVAPAEDVTIESVS